MSCLITEKKKSHTKCAYCRELGAHQIWAPVRVAARVHLVAPYLKLREIVELMLHIFQRHNLTSSKTAYLDTQSALQNYHNIRTTFMLNSPYLSDTLSYSACGHISILGALSILSIFSQTIQRHFSWSSACISSSFQPSQCSPVPFFKYSGKQLVSFLLHILFYFH